MLLIFNVRPYSKGTDPTMLLALLCDKFIDDAFPLAEELGDYLVGWCRLNPG